MKKRIILLVLLLLNVFFYSCSTSKETTEDESLEVVVPLYSNDMDETLKDDENEKNAEVNGREYERLKREHFKRQTKEVQAEMKKNEKVSLENTPVKERKTKRSLFKKKNDYCPNKVDNVMIMDGVSDVRP
ncbi:MAG: hypothetical protein J6U85_06455 [Bacteroidales bacterium]|nr:hypothetical protein [Bacteroidales bacterium]